MTFGPACRDEPPDQARQTYWDFMNEYGDYEDDYDEERDETPAEQTARLRAELDSGDLHVRPELAESLMAQANDALQEDRIEEVLAFVDEALEIAEQLIGEGRIEFLASVGRCMLFRAVVTRIHQGPEAGLVAFNETIRYLAERSSPEEMIGQNELAIALMNKADLLVDPLGAHSAAIAAQGQASRIWQKLLDDGQTELRPQLVSAFLSLGDAKWVTGDPAAAMEDFRHATAVIREGIESGETGLEGLLIQSLLKLTKLYARTGDVAMAFQASRESIQLLETAIAEGARQAEPALSALHLEQGMLFEQIGDSKSALTEYEYCRDNYLHVIEEGELTSPGDYIARTGLANVLMCCGNMLADLDRYEEAADSFEESIRWYRQAAEFRPEDDSDETFLAYSIGVVQLNLANMLASQDRKDEALKLKEEAIVALRGRLDAGHQEIIPNLVAAYRKIIALRRVLGQTEAMLEDVQQLVLLLDTVVDEGALEYRNELAATYYLRAACLEDQDKPEQVEKDLLHALRLFREVADDQADSAEVQWAKLQWGEIMERLALFCVRQGRIDDAMQFFKKEIDDTVFHYAEGNPAMVFDILFGYSQFVQFVDNLLREESQEHEKDDVRRWSQTALEAALAGIELIRKHRVDVEGDRALDMFFRMKGAFFRRYCGSFLHFLDKQEQAEHEFAAAAEQWGTLQEEMERMRLEKKYYEKEEEAFRNEHSEDSIDSSDDSVPKPWEHADVRPESSDQLFERWKYYVSELRQTLQYWALSCMENGKPDKAEELFERDVRLARDLIRRDIPNGDRFLVLSLVTFAKALDSTGDDAKAFPLYDEAMQLIRHRLAKDDAVPADFAMLKHVFLSYAQSLHRNDRRQCGGELLQSFVQILEHCPRFPASELWIELCDAVGIYSFYREKFERHLGEIRTDLLQRHPNYNEDSRFREYDPYPPENVDA